VFRFRIRRDTKSIVRAHFHINLDIIKIQSDMKSLLFVLLLIAHATFSLAQNEVEPNDDFATANGLNSGMTGFGNLYQNGPTDTYDYFTFLITENGSVDIEFIVTNESGSTLGADFVLFYSNTSQASGFNNVSVPVLETGGESFHFDCLASGSYFIRVSASGLMDYSIEYNVSSPISITESEPNGDFVIANSMQDGIVEAGELNFYNVNSDNYDFYKFTIDNYSTVDIVFEVTSTSSTNLSADFVLYNGGMGQISGFNYSSALSYQTNTESFTYPCLAPGDYYMRLEANSCMHYQISYTATSPFVATEIEPNNLFEEAMILEESVPITSYLAYTNESSDNFDYYRFTLTEYGSIAITVNATGTSSMDAGATFVGFYGDEIGFSGFNNFSASPGQTSTTEFEFHCFAPGDYYLRFSSNTCVAYEVSYEFTAYLAQTEIEPNDSFAQSTFLEEGTPQSGHIGFTNGAIDSFDYYRFTLETHGAVTITVNGYSSSSSDAFPTFVGFYGNETGFSGFSNFSTPAGENTSTDFVFNCFAPGDYYLRFSSSGCLAYEVSYVLNSPILATEVEPNNSLAEADQIQLDELVNGYVNYSNNPNYDYDDYFKVVVPDSSRTVMVCNFYETAAADNIGGSLYAYNSQGQMVGYKNVYLDDADVFTDSLAVDCYTGDTVWFRINITSCRAYDLVVHSVNRKPSAEFEVDRLGNTIGFVPQLENATSFTWSFDDGQTSASQFPLHTYTFGNWEPQLIAVNSTCNFTDTASYYFELSGVEYYTPHKGGRGGNVSLEIFGGSLTAETIVKLIKDGEEINPIEQYQVMDNNFFRAIFDLHLAEIGMYDVEITIPGLDPILYVDGFEVEEFKYPYAWSQVVGPSRWRVSRETPFSLVVGNNGNVTANGVMVGMVYPYGIDVELKHGFILPPDTGLFEVQVEDTLYSLDRSEIYFLYDSMTTFYEIDSLWGMPYHGWYGTFKIPYIPAGHTYELPFTATGNSSMPVEFITFTHKPNVFGSPITPNWYDTVENLGIESIDLVDMAADEVHNVPLQVLTKTLKVGRQHLAADARIAGAEFWAWWDGYEVPADTYTQYWKDIDAANAYAMKTGAEVLRDQALSLGNNYLNTKSQERIKGMNEMLAKTGNKLTDESFARVLANIGSEATTNGRLNVLFKTLKDAGTLADKTAAIEEMINNCPELADALNDLLNNANDNLNPDNIRKSPTNLVTSFDPNAIYGPMGVGPEQFLNNLDKHFFGIAFENADTATADAQIVRVLDTLDLQVFDPATFEFGDIMIAGQAVRVPRGRQEFALDFFLEGNSFFKVRLNGDFNVLTGIISWQLTTLDIATESIPLLDGFLPPNVTSPEGEGYLYYSVSPRTTLQSGDQLESTASIYFDTNDPIVTNTWSNTIDVLPPTSSISAFVENDTIIHIQLSGIDAGCGISNYKVYVSRNGGPFLSLFTTFEDEVVMVGEIGSTYGLYCEAIDSLGNGETKDAIAEVEVVTNISENNEVLTIFKIYPNPNDGIFTITPSAALQNSKLIIYNNLGAIVNEKRVNTLFGESIPLDMRSMAPGQYYIKLQTPNGSFAAQRIVTMK
jgi:hypothetical protein